MRGLILTLGALGFALLAPAARAQSNPSIGGWTVDRIEAAIQASADITLLERTTHHDTEVLIVEYGDVVTVLLPGCPEDAAPACTNVTMHTIYPPSMTAPLDLLNEMNVTSLFGWLGRDGQGRLASHHSLLLYDTSADELMFNIQVATTVFILRGREILRSSNMVQAGVEMSFEERAQDRRHPPEAALVLSADKAAALAAFEAEDRLSPILADPQRYAVFRKLASQLWGE